MSEKKPTPKRRPYITTPAQARAHARYEQKHPERKRTYHLRPGYTD